MGWGVVVMEFLDSPVFWVAALVLVILAGNALRRTFGAAAQYQRQVLEGFDRERLDAWWSQSDPRNQK